MSIIKKENKIKTKNNNKKGEKHMNLNLTKINSLKPDFKKLNEEITTIKTFYNEFDVKSKESKELFNELMNFQDEDGSFKLIDSFKIEKDARIAYCYYPTYLVTAIMIEAYLYDKNYCIDLEEKLKIALHFSTLRGLSNGDSYGEEYFDNVMIFVNKGARKFIDDYPNICNEFTDLLTKHINYYISKGKIK